MSDQKKCQEFLNFIKPQIGQQIHVGPWLEIEQKRINDFAEVTGDVQWIHTDVERAKEESPYKSTIAHGYLTLSLLPYLTESNHPDFFQKNYPGMKYRVNYGLNRLRFPSAVKAGAKIRARTTLHQVEEVKGGIQICYLITIDIEGGEKPACVAEFLARLYP
ncbi:MaoC family dehydratase [Desulfobacter sp.]|jgi:acyl dehydratase|uniref:MaoC family dehydratase n=1 Tax=Desulfobacter sp. TaxID=2294 RepID=UPI000E8AABC1|nr:MaoC family dehydratase [Desulfobacter sp.]MBP8830505.1 MaoC family dehydratase [Desulfobacter sp.]HBT88269.1 enoyl-CoA hydratase [Desulfobacter sp.]